jgi:hypothetical protein
MISQGEFNIHHEADGSVTLTYKGPFGPSRRTFDDDDALAFWWSLNASKYSLQTEVDFKAEFLDVLPRTTNKKGLENMLHERDWLKARAMYRVGDKLAFDSGSFHIGNGAQVEVVAVSMDHSHPSGHTTECWHPNHIRYSVATGYDKETGRATLRWDAREGELRHIVDTSGSDLTQCGTCRRMFNADKQLRACPHRSR